MTTATAVSGAAVRAPLCGVERRASPRLGLGLGLGHKPRFGGSASRVRRTCRGTSSVQEDVHTSSSSSVSTEDVDYASLAAKIDNVKERGLQLPSYAEADLAAALEELKKLDGMREGHADDLTMRWFLKDRDLDVEEAAIKVRKYNAWRVENKYENITLESVRDEFETGKAVLLEERDVLGRQVVSVTLTKHVIAERDLEDTKRLTVYLLDEGLKRINEGAARGEPETVLAVFDLR